MGKSIIRKIIIDIQIFNVEMSNSCLIVAYVLNNLLWKNSFSVSYDFECNLFNRVFCLK